MTLDDEGRFPMHATFVEQFNARRGPRSYTAAEFVEAFNIRCQRDGECLIWTGRYSAKTGYGSVSVCGRSFMVHRVAYWLTTGSMPDPTKEIDHLCKVRLCVEPSHLELVTHNENNLRSNSPVGLNARKTHCIHGHEFTPENTRITKHGKRDCRACNRARWHRTRVRDSANV